LGKGREVKHNNKVMGAIACGLSLAMTLGGPLSAIPAYAATVAFNQDLAGAKVANRTFNAYKIATFTPTDDGNVYTFVDGAKPVVTQVLKDMGVDMTGVTTDASIAGKISGLTASQQREFATKAAAALAAAGVTPTSITESGTLDDNSYYVIEETTQDTSVVKTTPFLLEVGTDPVTATLKSSQPSINKDITSAGAKDTKYDDVNIGDDVSFQLNDLKVPSTYGYDSYTYDITDQMSGGLTISKAQLQALTLKIGGTEVIPGDSTYTVYVIDGTTETAVNDLAEGWSAKGAKFVIKFNPKYFIGTYDETEAKKYTQTPAPGTDITVDFAATLNEDAQLAAPEENKTLLTYSNTPTTVTDSQEHKVYVYTFGVEVQKSFTDKQDLFDQVEFGIAGGAGDIYVTGSNGDYTVAKQGTAGAVSAASGLKLDSTGHFQIKGLDEGTYTVTETKVPDGYTSNGPQTITITPDFGTDGAKGKAGETVTVENDTDSDGYVDGAMVNKPNTFHLPDTGEIGMFLLPAAGLGIMGAVLVTSSKKKSNKDE
jgi:fimbrial isopeptide formation D2 family protein/LPXTG-motif cell wall-anchored protein